MPKKSQTDAPSALSVVRRFRAAGECPELGVHSIPLGYVEVEELSDGTFRMADDLTNALPSMPSVAPVALPDAVESAPDADVVVLEVQPSESDPSAADAVSEAPAPADEPPASE